MLLNENQRLNYFIESKGVSKRSVEIALNFPNGYIKKVKNYGESQLLAIKSMFPELNMEWLTTGVGQMIDMTKVKEAYPLSIETPNVIYNKNGVKCTQLEDGTFSMEIKLVNDKAHAGYKNAYADPEYIENLPTHIIHVDEIKRGFYRAFQITGDSMDGNTRRAIWDKAIVTGRNISKSLWSSKLHINQWDEFIIVTKDDGILCKEIIAHDVDKGIITCHSYNEDKKNYPDFDLNLNDVIELYNVIKVENPR